LLLLAWILLAWAKTFGVQPLTGLMNHIPLMRQANFFRYAPPSWSLALIILAAFGLDDFRNNTPGRRSAFGITIGLLVIAIALAWPQRAFWERPRAFVPLMFLLLGLSLAWALAGLLAAALSWKLLHGERRRIVLACLLVVDAAMMFIVPQSTAIRGNQIDLPAVQFLSDHQGLSRSYTLGPMEPNYGAYFRVANIDHNVVPVPKLWADYVEHNLLPSSSRLDSSLPFYSSMTFWPGVMPDGDAQQDLSDNLDNYLSLGVRYVIAKPGQSPTPITFLPTTDVSIQSGASGTQFNTPRLGMLLAALERCRSIANDPTKPAAERLLAKLMLRVGHSIAGGPTQESIHTNAESVAPLDTEYITLQRGQSVEVGVSAPSPVRADSAITSVGAMVSNCMPVRETLACRINRRCGFPNALRPTTGTVFWCTDALNFYAPGRLTPCSASADARWRSDGTTDAGTKWPTTRSHNTTRFRIWCAGIAQSVFRFCDGHLGTAKPGAVFPGNSGWPLHSLDHAARRRDCRMRCARHPAAQRALYARLEGLGKSCTGCGSLAGRSFPIGCPARRSQPSALPFCASLYRVWLGCKPVRNGRIDMATYPDRTLPLQQP
jgi:hypothetical protein